MRDIVVAEPIIRDLQTRLGCHDLFAWLEEQAEQLSCFGGVSSIHVSLNKSLFRERRIVSIKRDRNLTHHGIIRGTGHGYSIRIHQGLPSRRVRFVLAHEIAHTYFLNSDGSPISSMQRLDDRTVESLCNFFARTLLMPRNRVISRLETLGWGALGTPPLHMVPGLADDFDVSEEVVARRLVFDLTSDIDAVVCITDHSKPNCCADWKVNWCVTEAQCRLRMPSGWRIPLTTSQRKIPLDMVPVTPEGQTVRVAVDGRWHESVRPKPESESRKWLSRQRPSPRQPAFFALVPLERHLFGRSMRRCYLAI